LAKVRFHESFLTSSFNVETTDGLLLIPLLNTSIPYGALYDVVDDDGLGVDNVKGIADVVVTGVARLDNVPNRLV
jgi:hypothetical protein